MRYDDVLILIPSHGLEDFPTDLAETEAASILNCFAVAWHPLILANSRMLPRWSRADSPLAAASAESRRLIFVPTCSSGWLQHGFCEEVERSGGTCVRGLSERDAILAAALAELGGKHHQHQGGAPVESPYDPQATMETAATVAVDPVMSADDFMALGHCYLQVELLSRRMRHFGDINEGRMRIEAVAAAQAAIAGDTQTTETRLKNCFDILAEARERFYPVDCYLIDFCLLNTTNAAEPAFESILTSRQPCSLLCTAEDLQQVCAEHPKVHTLLREAWHAGTADLVGGEFAENTATIQSMESLLWQFSTGRNAFRALFGKVPTVWGRRLFGLTPQLPQILTGFGYGGSLHLVLDDGIYPDEESTKFRWEGSNGAVIDAMSRIPLAGDSAISFLRFAQRMSESMDNDHIAGLMFARWPTLKSPFLNDFIRSQRYAPVLGKLVTLKEFFSSTTESTSLSRHRPSQYLTPFVFQAVAFSEPAPVSRFIRKSQLRAAWNTAAWLHGTNQLLRGRGVEYDTPLGTAAAQETLASLETRLEMLPDSASDTDLAGLHTALASAAEHAATAITSLLYPATTNGTTTTAAASPNDNRNNGDCGYIVLNPTAYEHTAVVHFGPTNDQMFGVMWKDSISGDSTGNSSHGDDANSGEKQVRDNLPVPVAAPSRTAAGEAIPAEQADSGTVSGVQWDERHRLAIITVPPAGFVYCPATSNESAIIGQQGAGSATAATGSYAASKGPSGTRARSTTLVSSPMVNGLTLQNDVLEVRINASTGGIAEIRRPMQRGNRLSQQLAFRFPKERTFWQGEGESRTQIKTPYAGIRCMEVVSLSTGPAVGELLSTGELFDQPTGDTVATFRQITRVYRGLSRVDVEVEFEPTREPEAEPWHSYFGSRWAWHDPAAVISGWHLGSTFVCDEERIESSQFLELASGEQRATILTGGLPFHRKSGPRMLDTIMIVKGESRRRFEFSIVIDNPYAVSAATTLMQSPIAIPVSHGPPAFGNLAWFFRMDVRGVRILGLHPLMAESGVPTSSGQSSNGGRSAVSEEIPAWDTLASSSQPVAPQGGVTVRLQETEGRSVRAALQCFRPPVRARQRNFNGKTIIELPVKDESVMIDFSSHEIADVELFFDA